MSRLYPCTDTIYAMTPDGPVVVAECETWAEVPAAIRELRKKSPSVTYFAEVYKEEFDKRAP